MCSGELQKKVQAIALLCIGLHVIDFIGEAFHVLPLNRGDFGRLPKNKEALPIFIESMIGSLTGTLLYIGAKTKNKYLLIPFMLVMNIACVLLFLALITVGCLFLANGVNRLWTAGFVGIFMLFFMLLLTSWILKTTLALYKEIGTFNAHNNSRMEEMERQMESSIVPARRIAGEVVITNDIESNLCVQLPIDTNLHPTTEIPIISPSPRRPPPEEQPPGYTALATMDNSGAELPPSYDEALALKTQNLESIV